VKLGSSRRAKREVKGMDRFVNGVEAEVSGMTGLALGAGALDVEVLEERIAPWLIGIGIGGGGCGCECHCSSS
jgi:hypothetical protein